MSLGLALLCARRVASPLAIILVGAATWAVASQGDDARSSWLFGGALAALLATVRAAAVPDAWLRGEGDWLGTTALGRGGLVASAFAGATAGAILLMGAVAASVHLTHPNNDSPVELSATGGPDRSIVLGPTEAFTLPLGEAAADVEGAVRVRATVTIGAEAPTTRALIERIDSSGQTTEQNEVSVARRTWLEVGLDDAADSVRVTNVGAGALAILGPRPVEVWHRSSAWLAGTPRALAHAAAWILALASGALALGVVMGPGIAAALSFSLWLVSWWIADLLGGTGWPIDCLPGGPATVRALDAIAEGRVPSAPAASVWLTAALAFCTSCGLGAALLRSWRDEVRG